jgi:hypothetical protein
MSPMNSRFLLLTAILLAATPAAAQTFQTTPQPGFGQPQQEPPCFKEFSKLRDDAQSKAKAAIDASKRKAPPQEACKLLNSLVSSETKLVKYVEANASWCGIPPQVVTQMKQQHGGTAKARDRVCQFASRPQGPAAPSLSDALGTSRLPDSSNIRTGRGGTFDTLTGSPLGKQ